MLTYREFLSQKISYLISHFQKNCILLDHSGNQLRQINLSLQCLTDQYLSHCQQLQQQTSQQLQLDQMSLNQSLKINQSDLQIKINDKDLYNFWKVINPTYQLSFNLENQNVTDQSLLKLAQLYQENMCAFNRLKFKGNTKITQIGLIKLGQALRNNTNIKQINLNRLTIPSNGVNRIIQLIGVTNVQTLDLGFITNQSLIYLAKNLENAHSLESISFGQNTSDKWSSQGKQSFQMIIRRGQHSKRIISINVSHPDPLQHYQFISELNILIKKNRKSYVDHCQDQFKAASLNPKHTSYYDPDNHNLNAYKFSVKSYLTNVFGSLLDQALYFLEKQRRNQLREEVTFDITKQPVNKIILEDICTSDGSIIVLTKYLLAKIKQKQKDFNGTIS